MKGCGGQEGEFNISTVSFIPQGMEREHIDGDWANSAGSGDTGWEDFRSWRRAGQSDLGQWRSIRSSGENIH